MDLDPEEANLQIILNLNKNYVITNNINSISDSNENFCCFTSGGIEYLVWATTDHNLEIFDLKHHHMIKECKNAHSDWINSCHHFFDNKLKKDLLITSSDDKTIKLWSFEDMKTLLTVKNDTIGNFRNAYLIPDPKLNKNFILAEVSDYIIVLYDFEGKFLRKFNDSILHDIWWNKDRNELQIVTSYAGKVHFYDLFTGKIHKEFQSEGHLASAAVVNNLLVVADESGTIKTFDIVHFNKLHQAKASSSVNLLTVWDIEFIIALLDNGKIEIYETKTLTKIKTIDTLCEKVVYAEPFIHPLFGVSLVMSGPTGMNKGILYFLYQSENSTVVPN
jgi:WD40 repeat protein